MMQDQNHPTSSLDMSSSADWGVSYVLGICEQCDWGYLAPLDRLPTRCPNCQTGKLEALNSEAIQPLAKMVKPPEMFLPFKVTQSQMSRQIEQFATGLRFPPEDLTSQRLQQRLTRMYLPVWLVDGHVKAIWQAEVGFNYQVKSHQEHYGDGSGWKTREVMETRQRWEPRMGKLDRSYQNVSAPAMEKHHEIVRTLGDFSYEQAQNYDPDQVFAGMPEQAYIVRLPDRDQRDAWPDAQPRFQANSAEECRQAIGADHIREFRWSPEFLEQNWTLLLLPVLTTFYLDDENQPQQIWVHGQSGKLNGVRRASMRRARGVALTILMVALLFFVLSLCAGVIATFNPLLLVVAGIGIFVSLAIALGAIYPVGVVWSINRKL